MKVSPKLIDYIHKAKKAGMTEKEIIDKLLSVGHTREVIHHHLHHYHAHKRKKKLINFGTIILVFALLLVVYLMIDNSKDNLNESKTVISPSTSSTSSTTTSTFVTVTSTSTTTTSPKNITINDLTSSDDFGLFMNSINDTFIRMIDGKKLDKGYMINDGGRLMYLKGLNVNSINLNYEVPSCSGELLGLDEVNQIFKITSFTGTFKYELNKEIDRLNLEYTSECNVPLIIKSIEVES